MSSHQHWRQLMRQRRRELPQPQRDRYCREICSHVLNSEPYAQAKRIAAYLPFAGEPDLRPALRSACEAGKTVLVPRVEGRQMTFVPWRPDLKLTRNRFGIEEPAEPQARVSPRELDLVLCPLVAFDPSCHRIGMGSGFYDRSFAFVRDGASAPLLVGIAFELQQVAAIQPQPWDVALHAVVSDRGWRWSGSA